MLAYEDEHNVAYIKRTAGETVLTIFHDSEQTVFRRIDQKAYLGIPGG